MKPTTDIDTIANADDLWRLVHAVQDVIPRDVEDYPPPNKTVLSKLATLRDLADELDPEYGKH